MSKDEVLKASGGMIFINASYRRTITNPWVFLTFGYDVTISQIWDDIVTGGWADSPVIYYNYYDLHYWHKAITRERKP